MTLLAGLYIKANINTHELDIFRQASHTRRGRSILQKITLIGIVSLGLVLGLSLTLSLKVPADLYEVTCCPISGPFKAGIFHL